MTSSLKRIAEKIVFIIEEEYPKQKNVTGSIQSIYQLANEIVESGEVAKNINLKSLVRMFADETTHYQSEIIYLLQDLDKELKKNERQRQFTTFFIKQNKKNREQLLSNLEKWTLFVPIRWVDKQTFRILHIQDGTENFYLPILTSQEEQLPPISDNNSIRLGSVRLSDCIQLLQSNHQIAGIVLNPMSDNVVLPSALFHGQNTTEKQVSFGVPSKDYSWLTTPLISFLQQNTGVRTVYLLMVVRENQPVATLVVDGEEKDCLAIVDYLNHQQYSEAIDILPLQTAFSKEIIKDVSPFYTNLQYHLFKKDLMTLGEMPGMDAFFVSNMMIERLRFEGYSDDWESQFTEDVLRATQLSQQQVSTAFIRSEDFVRYYEPYLNTEEG